MMKVAVFLLLLTSISCRAAPRDYTSLNRHSLRFVRDAASDGYRLSKQELRRDFQMKDRARFNLYQAKGGRRFIYNTIWADEGANFMNMLRGVGDEFVGMDARKTDIRFGFLDSGE